MLTRVEGPDQLAPDADGSPRVPPAIRTLLATDLAVIGAAVVALLIPVRWWVASLAGTPDRSLGGVQVLVIRLGQGAPAWAIPLLLGAMGVHVAIGALWWFRAPRAVRLAALVGGSVIPAVGAALFLLLALAVTGR